MEPDYPWTNDATSKMKSAESMLRRLDKHRLTVAEEGDEDEVVAEDEEGSVAVQVAEEDSVDVEECHSRYRRASQSKDA